MKFKLTKVQGSENDFFIIDELETPRLLTKEEIEQLRINICDRKDGLLGGADGLLLIRPASHEEAIAKMRVINNDGSEASMCGNGLRTVGRYLFDKTGMPEFVIETMHADLKVRKASDIGEGIETFQVEISPVSFQAETIPMYISGRETMIDRVIPELSDTLKFSVVAVPNPHLVAFVNKEIMASDLQEKIATRINGENEWFPKGINVSFVEIKDKKEIFVRTFERGVGFTNACGTAMCASSLMFVLLHDGEFNDELIVRNPGGIVKTVVHQDPEGSYWMELIGNASVTHQIKGEQEDLLSDNFANLQIEETDENKKYLDFLAKIKI